MIGDLMRHREEPLVNSEVGPQSEEFEFLVDTGADKSSIKKLLAGITISERVCVVVGVEGRSFKAPLAEGVEIKGNSQHCLADLIYLLLNLESNLLGRDLQVQLGVGIIPKGGRIVVHIMELTSGDIEEINPEVWVEEGRRGYLNIPAIEMQKETPPI